MSRGAPPSSARSSASLTAPRGAAELAQFGEWRAAARALLARGLIVSGEVTTPMPPSGATVRRAGPALNAEQAAAVAATEAALDHYGAFLLHGVTGSGKTEVYLRLIERVLAAGRRALVLVPEIGLTPQLVARFRERFDTPLAVLHSALTDAERLAAWREAYGGRARMVLGTRSAVFAPVPQLGLIVVDEEHDASFKQHEGSLRYSARDLAVVRARGADVPVVLGSATPSLETLHNVAAGRYQRAAPASAAPRRRSPRVLKLIDLRAHATRQGIATPAVLAIERHLAGDGQVLVFLNRRGYAPTLLCTGCGWIAPCRECDARMTVHQGAARLRCHHCGADAPLPERCPQCGYAVKPVGQGTERIEEALAALFPGVSVARLDRDVVRRRGDMEAVVARMRLGRGAHPRRHADGHQGPRLSQRDAGRRAQRRPGPLQHRLPRPRAPRADHRAGRRPRRAAARAGRGADPDASFPSTRCCTNLLARGLRRLRARRARGARAGRLAALQPPRGAARLGGERRRRPRLSQRGAAPRRRCRRAACGCLGPVPAAMAKRAGRYHAQLLIESSERASAARLPGRVAAAGRGAAGAAARCAGRSTSIRSSSSSSAPAAALGVDFRAAGQADTVIL